jgi:hypothetical protein
MADLTSGSRRRGEFPESVVREFSGEYDHDEISNHDLMELGVLGASFGLFSVEPHVADAEPGVPGNALVLLAGPEGAFATANTAGQVQSDTVIPSLATVAFEVPVVASEAATGSLPDIGDVNSFEVFNFDEEDIQSAQDDPLDQLWYLEVPEAGDEEVAREVSREGVSSDERATQLALAFLQDEGLYSQPHLDFLADIIRQRGWSSVQTQVRGLVLAGYDITQVYRMFQLTDAWMHCVESDTLAPERWRGGKRLTWLESAHLLDFLGYDVELEEIADFLSLELEVWRELRRDSGQLATFKNYLFKYRLSLRTEVSDDVWQSNLDPSDMRSFDGSRNPLYLSSWWDEPLDSGARDIKQMFGAICDAARIADWLSSNTEELF